MTEYKKLIIERIKKEFGNVIDFINPHGYKLVEYTLFKTLENEDINDCSESSPLYPVYITSQIKIQNEETGNFSYISNMGNTYSDSNDISGEIDVYDTFFDRGADNIFMSDDLLSLFGDIEVKEIFDNLLKELALSFVDNEEYAKEFKKVSIIKEYE